MNIIEAVQKVQSGGAIARASWSVRGDKRVLFLAWEVFANVQIDGGFMCRWQDRGGGLGARHGKRNESYGWELSPEDLMAYDWFEVANPAPAPPKPFPLGDAP